MPPSKGLRSYLKNEKKNTIEWKNLFIKERSFQCYRKKEILFKYKNTNHFNKIFYRIFPSQKNRFICIYLLFYVQLLFSYLLIIYLFILTILLIKLCRAWLPLPLNLGSTIWGRTLNFQNRRILPWSWETSENPQLY